MSIALLTFGIYYAFSGYYAYTEIKKVSGKE